MSFALRRSEPRHRLEKPMHTQTKGLISLACSIGAAMTLVSLTATTAAAQATLTGCYVPNSGTVYRIKGAGLPNACHSKNHVEFTWSLQGPPGPTGPAGPTGAQGPVGPAGGLPAAGIEYKGASGSDIPAGSIGSVTVDCSTGKVPIGGGYENHNTPMVRVFQSSPDLSLSGGPPTGWRVSFQNQSTIASSIFAWVVCVPAS